MDTTSVVKEHKFFIRDLDTNLQSLYDWTINLDNNIRSGNININADKETLNVYKDRPSGAGTALLSYYNIFNMGNSEIEKLKNGIHDALKEACEYYGIDYNSEEWYLHGWFNRNAKEDMWDVSPLDHDDKWHEHMNGVGAPVFHGYFCVNAEPSVTVYQIFKNPNNIKVNVNKNNRLVVSEVGHPHGMGNWRSDETRITLAYDIAPRVYISDEDAQTWTRLN
mgnify:CR=1 FL=1